MVDIKTKRHYTPTKLREKISSKLIMSDEQQPHLSLDISMLKRGLGFDLKNIADCINGKGFFEESENPQNRVNKRPQESVVDRLNNQEVNLPSQGLGATSLVIDATKFGQERTFKLLETLGQEGTSLKSLEIKNLNLNTPKKSERFADALDGFNSLESLELFSLRSNKKSAGSFVNKISENSTITDLHMTARDGRYVTDSTPSYLKNMNPARLVKGFTPDQNRYYDYYNFGASDLPAGMQPVTLPQIHADKIHAMSSDSRQESSKRRVAAGVDSLQELATVVMEQELEKTGSKSSVIKENLTKAMKEMRLNTNPGEDSHVLRLQKSLAKLGDKGRE